MDKKNNTRKYSPRHQSAQERLLEYSFFNQSGCIEWTGAKNKRGYGILKWERKSTLAHRLAYETFCEEIPKEKHVLHKCDNPKCINTDHLFLGSNKENVNDRVLKNRSFSPKGEKNNKAILSKKDILVIRKLKEPYSVIAKKFGVCKSTIGWIKTNQTWRHI